MRTQEFASLMVKSCNITDETFDVNHFSDNPDPRTLANATDTLPAFSDKRVVVLHDVNVEKYDDKAFFHFVELIETLPDSTTLIIYVTGFALEKSKSRTKTFISTADKHGTICEFSRLNPAKAGELLAREYPGAISREHAEFLAQATACSTARMRLEMGKLVASGSQITRDLIERLVSPQLEVRVFELSNCVMMRKIEQTFTILRDLSSEGTPPEMILPALSSSFIAIYYAKVSLTYGTSSADAALAFGYAENRINFAYKSARNVEFKYLKSCVNLLENADIMMKNSHNEADVILVKLISDLFYIGKSLPDR